MIFVWEGLLELLLPTPSMCVLCEQPMESLSICDACIQRWERLQKQEGKCQRCGTYGSRATCCDTCRDWPAYYIGNQSLLPYNETVRDAIVRFKFHNEPWRIKGFAPLVAKQTPPAVDFIVPVPLHRRRLQERGYNQSLLIARLMGECWQLPVEDKLLLRVVNTAHQIDLPRSQRLLNVAKAFEVAAARQSILQDAHVLLVDDVMTTGSTLLACARALHKAGAKTVESYTLATGIR